MAIDNAEKRRSVAGIPFFIFLGVTPNTLKDREWRQQVGWGYSGITGSTSVTGAAGALAITGQSSRMDLGIISKTAVRIG